MVSRAPIGVQNCPNCLAPVAPNAQVCRYCRAPLLVAHEGRAVLETWSRSACGGAHFLAPPGDPAQVFRAEIAKAGQGALAIAPLFAPGMFDDVDVSVSIRFVMLGQGISYAGFSFREVDTGSYRFVVSSDGQFRIGTFVAPREFGTFVPWTKHPALATGIGALNRIRLLAIGTQIRVELNDALGASVTIQRHFAGKLSLFAGCESGPSVVDFSALKQADPHARR